MNIAHQRLHSQKLINPTAKSPAEIVHWLGAVQAQEYAWAKWSLALRLDDVTDAEIERAINDGEILRTHVLRPTWHFVTPQDIRWMLELTAARVQALNATIYRQYELDPATLTRASAIIVNALVGGHALPRSEIARLLAGHGISTTPIRLSFILHYMELEALICSGASVGTKQTHALLEERAPQAKSLPREEALAEHVRRFFTSRAPATVHDYAWWSGLTVKESQQGIDSLHGQLHREVIDGKTYWYATDTPIPASLDQPHAAYLLPNFDEYTLYRGQHFIMSPQAIQHLQAHQTNIYAHFLLSDHKLIAIWKRTIKGRSLQFQLAPFAPLTEQQSFAYAQAAQHYAKFIEMPVTLVG